MVKYTFKEYLMMVKDVLMTEVHMVFFILFMSPELWFLGNFLLLKGPSPRG